MFLSKSSLAPLSWQVHVVCASNRKSLWSYELTYWILKIFKLSLQMMEFLVSVLCCCWPPDLKQFSINSIHGAGRHILCHKKRWRTSTHSQKFIEHICNPTPLPHTQLHKILQGAQYIFSVTEWPRIYRFTQICTVAQLQNAKKSTVPALFGELCENRRKAKGQDTTAYCSIPQGLGGFSKSWSGIWK